MPFENGPDRDRLDQRPYGSSALATPAFTTAAMLQENSAAFMVFLCQGDEHVDSMQLSWSMRYLPKRTSQTRSI